MTELVEFLLARIADDESVISMLGSASDWIDPWALFAFAPEPSPLELNRNRLLAECQAKRLIVNRCLTLNEQADQLADESGPTRASFEGQALAWRVALRFIAQPYADHPDFREEWLG